MRGLWMLPKRSRIYRLHKFLFMLFIVFIVTFYLTVNKQDDDDSQYLIWGPCSEPNEVSDQKYLVWNSKCHMLSMSPNDSSIKRFVKKEEFETCSTKPLLSSLSRSNRGIYLLIDHNVMAEHYGNLSCCWAEVTRGPPSPKSSKATNFDSVISFQQTFRGAAAMANKSATKKKPLSVLVLGLDSVSRLNFFWAMPTTRTFFQKRGWVELRGYNKMGDNTFPNLMAILTGQNQSAAYASCKPTLLYSLDNCSMIWYNFRNAGYATAYAEDHAQISTFNYLKSIDRRGNRNRRTVRRQDGKVTRAIIRISQTRSSVVFWIVVFVVFY